MGTQSLRARIEPLPWEPAWSQDRAGGGRGRRRERRRAHCRVVGNLPFRKSDQGEPAEPSGVRCEYVHAVRGSASSAASGCQTSRRMKSANGGAAGNPSDVGSTGTGRDSLA